MEFAVHFTVLWFILLYTLRVCGVDMGLDMKHEVILK